jgi:hypothetical protein
MNIVPATHCHPNRLGPAIPNQTQGDKKHNSLNWHNLFF